MVKTLVPSIYEPWNQGTKKVPRPRCFVNFDQEKVCGFLSDFPGMQPDMFWDFIGKNIYLSFHNKYR
jgi:hypothetical protein